MQQRAPQVPPPEIEDTHWFHRSLHRHLRRGLAQVLGHDSARCLDAGCGTGAFLRRTRQRAPHWTWTGVDIDPSACAAARARADAEIIEASVTALPFPDATFDGIVCADLLQQLPDDQAALLELKRVLRPRGVLVVNVPAAPAFFRPFDTAPADLRRYRAPEFTAQLGTAGFNDIRLARWHALPLPALLLKHRLFGVPWRRTPLRPTLAPLAAAYRALLAGERWWLSHGRSFPVGTALLAIARKSAKR